MIVLDEIYEGYTYLELNIDNLKMDFIMILVRKDIIKKKKGLK
jgi:hypothetical protein